MKRIFISIITVVLCLTASNAKTQTRFQVPDTTPNYSSYKYVDECLVAVKRLMFQDSKKEVFWTDTLPPDSLFKIRLLSPETLKSGKACLQKINLDTISVGKVLTYSKEKELTELVQTLLVIDRDEDVMRLFKQLLDSASTASEWYKIYSLATLAYHYATPPRISGFKHLLENSYHPGFTDKDLDAKKIYVELEMGWAAISVGDTLLAKQTISDIMYKLSLDSLRTLQNWQNSYFIRDAYSLAYEALIQQGMDSLKVSTDAYRIYLEDLFSRFYQIPLSASHESAGEKAPLITGKYWYQNGWSVTADGKIELSDKVAKINPQDIPKRGKINALLVLQAALCHAASYRPPTVGRTDGMGKNGNGGVCWESASMIKRLKEEFPELEVAVLTRTFGSIGGSAPIPPEQEADRLSSYLLGFYKIPGIHAISETEFFRLPDLDRRRIDHPVGYQKDYLGLLGDEHPTEPPTGVVILIDEDGKIFHNQALPRSRDRAELIMRKKLAAVFSRLKQ